MDASNNSDYEQFLKINDLNHIKSNINEQINSKNYENINSMGNFTMQNEIDPIDTLLMINETLRTNIKLSLAIYKQLNNFYHKHINEFPKLKTTKNSDR